MLDLTGKRALITGIANNRSIAWGIAQQLHAAGARLAVTYLPDERGKFEGKVTKLTEPLAPEMLLPCNVGSDEQIEGVFEAIADQWGGLDILIHCLAFVKKEELSGDFTNTSRDGFSLAMDISSFSLVALCKAAKPLMGEGSSVVTLSYLGGVRVVPNYNMAGITKAALEMNVRYLASELGPQGTRVNAISAGPIRTLASAAIGDFHSMLNRVEEKAPLRRNVTQTEVGNTAAFLCSDLASGITGQTIYVDSGFSILGA
ncbi:enoyl-ACP reductase FabI [Synechococcus sp. PCC 7336]|uniref:enoyl-ACP reductase FabI n=1 Tax=Synechococcus sp. PCC 7336 TaxID=195250 RepID=UPI000475610A|nr:enoyl-ACP reductase FabI [Synechococcus sp. PCC 7336]